ncbi:MAG: rRNA maturation RNase YbeY [Candidatus Nanopelagicaceae bacterium]|jgi:probable rRNA maturation factor|nr:rRNA maturation RNase YbeY [Candidatus Nanopelagicaceae bacterium]
MIEIENRSGQLVPESEIQKLLEFSIRELGLHPECELTLAFINDAEMEELHIKWMDLPGSTDVMSFPMDELKPNDPEPGILGDIVISPVFARAQAEKAGHSFEHEIKILAAHGLLHLLGYDHQELDEEKVMFALQEDLVKRSVN